MKKTNEIEELSALDVRVLNSLPVNHEESKEIDNETLNLDNTYQDITNDLKQLDAELKPLYERDINNSRFQGVQELFKKSYETFELTKQTYFKFLSKNQRINYNNENLNKKLSGIIKQLTTEMIHLRSQQLNLVLTEALEELAAECREIRSEVQLKMEALRMKVPSAN